MGGGCLKNLIRSTFITQNLQHSVALISACGFVMSELTVLELSVKFVFPSLFCNF